MEKARKIVLGITGASGSIYARLLLERLSSLKKPPQRVAVILTETAEEVWYHETGAKFSAAGNAKRYPIDSYHAPFASGSSDFDTMIICPASMGTTGRIANGTSDNLIIRAADVMLKERKRLIIVPREAPYNLIHLKNMETLTLAGAIICPASPSFYSRPSTVDEVAMTIVERILSLAGFEADIYRWKEDE